MFIHWYLLLKANVSYPPFVIQKVCVEVEKSERAVEKLQEDIAQLKEEIGKQKTHSEEHESKIYNTNILCVFERFCVQVKALSKLWYLFKWILKKNQKCGIMS